MPPHQVTAIAKPDKILKLDGISAESVEAHWALYEGYVKKYNEITEKMAAAAASGEALFNVASQPIRRIGRPEDIADLALFFASRRSAHLTGQLVSVSGGSYMP